MKIIIIIIIIYIIKTVHSPYQNVILTSRELQQHAFLCGKAVDNKLFDVFEANTFKLHAF